MNEDEAVSELINAALLNNELNSVLIYAEAKLSNAEYRRGFYGGAWSMLQAVTEIMYPDFPTREEMSGKLGEILLKYAKDFR